MNHARHLIVNKAREFLGTPYHHQGRVKGAGIDCAGLVICVAHELKLSEYDLDNYPKESDGVELQQLFSENAISARQLDIGNIILLKIKKVPQHCGIIAFKDNVRTFIHACRKRQKVVEIELTKDYIRKVVNVYEFPNIDKL